MEVLEILFIALCIVTSICCGVFTLIWILDRFFSDDYPMFKSGHIFKILPILLISIFYIGFWFEGVGLKETKTEYSISDLTVVEFDNEIRYCDKDGNMVYRLTAIREFKQKQNIIGFVRFDRKGWGPDSININPIYSAETK